MSFAARHWYRLSPVSVLLVPVGLLFRFLAGRHDLGLRLVEDRLDLRLLLRSQLQRFG